MTYSIVAHCPKTGALGVAVQSHWFNVGANVPMIEPGVGAVATQSATSRADARAVLANLRNGRTVEEALAEAGKLDEQWSVRQLGVVDWRGTAALHTGSKCVPFAGSVAADGVACQANFMENEGVPEAMMRAWNDNPTLDIAERLMAALNAAEAGGGDIRGRQSAALVVFDADSSVVDPVYDLRVEDHPAPLPELARVLKVARAYQHANEGDKLVAVGDNAAASREYRVAMDLAPEITELAFWYALSLADSGNVGQAIKEIGPAFAERSQMRDLVTRLQGAGWVSLDDKALDAFEHCP